jgi:hypothetical protein
MIKLRNMLSAVSGVLSALWLLAMALGGGPQSAGEIILLVWAVAALGASVLTHLGNRRPRAQSLGPVGERTP